MQETPLSNETGSDVTFENTDELVSRLIVEEKRRNSPMLLPELAPAEDRADDDRTKPRKQPIAKVKKAIKKNTAKVQKSDEPKPKKKRFTLPKFALPKLPRLALRKKSSAKDDLQETAELNQITQQTTGGDLATDKPPVWRTGISRLCSLLAKIRKKHVVYALLAFIVLTRPLLLPLVLLVLFWVVLIVYLSLGPDRARELVVANWLRLQKRNPKLAERLRQRADRFAERFDRVLDWLPERWAEKLSLPDFSKTSDLDSRPDPFDRLVSETRQS